MEMPFQCFSLKSPLDGSAITHHVEVAVLKVYDPLPVRRREVRFSNVPLQGNGPIKYLRAARHFLDCQGNMLLKLTESLAHALPRDTSADRIE